MSKHSAGPKKQSGQDDAPGPIVAVPGGQIDPDQDQPEHTDPIISGHSEDA